MVKKYIPKSTYTLYLNSEVNCNKYAVGSKNLQFNWDISPIIINENAKLKVFLLQYQGVGSNNNVITFKLRDVLYNNSVYYSSDGSYPTIFAGLMNQTTQTNVYFTGGGTLDLIPQAINTITIITTDSLTDITSGIDNTLKFVIGITIEDFDVETN